LVKQKTLLLVKCIFSAKSAFSKIICSRHTRYFLVNCLINQQYFVIVYNYTLRLINNRHYVISRTIAPWFTAKFHNHRYVTLQHCLAQPANRRSNMPSGTTNRRNNLKSLRPEEFSATINAQHLQSTQIRRISGLPFVSRRQSISTFRESKLYSRYLSYLVLRKLIKSKS
jgi:hypothetical protein